MSLLITHDADQWARIGSTELQFFATDEEVQHWLVSALPAAYAPYYLLGTDKVRRGRTYVDEPFDCPIDNLRGCREGAAGRRFQSWIASEHLTPEWHLLLTGDLDKLCSYNGLILLQHGLVVEGHIEASRIAITYRVRNRITGEVRTHDGYWSVYKPLRSAIRHELTYSSIVRFADGHEEEITRLQRMTAGAVRSHEAGYPLRNRPGRLLRGAPHT